MKSTLIPILCLLVLMACAPSIHVKVLVPSEINLSPVKKIAVLDFNFTGDWDFNVKDEPLTLKGAITKAIAEQLGVLKKHPKPDPQKAFPGRDVSAEIINQLVGNGFYTVLEREQLDKVLKEHALNQTGVIDEDQAVEIGKMLGVEALMLGSGKYIVRDGGMWEEHAVLDSAGEPMVNDQGKPVKILKYKAVRKIDLELNFRIVKVETGEIVASRSYKRSNYNDRAKNKKYQCYSIDKIKAQAVSNLPHWKPVVSGYVKSIAPTIVRTIAPHHVSRRKKLDKGKHPAFKAAAGYAKRGMWEEARSSWESVLQAGGSVRPKDQVAALYNLGVYFEIHGMLDKAEKNYSECYQKTGKSKYLDAKAAIQARKRELERLEKQMQETDSTS